MANEIEKRNGAFLIYQDENGITRVNVRFEGEDVWLNLEQMMELFDASQQDVSYHINQIYAEGEQDPERTRKNFLIVRQEGNRSVKRNMYHYNLDMIIAVGYRVKSQVATRFRQWATIRLREFIQKGFTLDDDRLDDLMKLSGRQLLVGKGTISHEEAKKKAIAEFEKYRKLEMLQYESDYDRAIRELIQKENNLQ